MTYAPDVTTDRFRTKFIAWVFSGFSIASVVDVPVGTWVPTRSVGVGRSI